MQAKWDEMFGEQKVERSPAKRYGAKGAHEMKEEAKMKKPVKDINNTAAKKATTSPKKAVTQSKK